MTWRHLQLLAKLSILAALCVAAGCFSPAGPPSPPLEIPALVAFPSSVGIDVSKAVGGSPAALVTEEKNQSDITDFSAAISLGPLTFNAFNLLLDDFLGPLSELEIPVSPTVVTFSGPIAFTPGIVATVKIDFSDFDLD